MSKPEPGVVKVNGTLGMASLNGKIFKIKGFDLLSPSPHSVRPIKVCSADYLDHGE